MQGWRSWTLHSDNNNDDENKMVSVIKHFLVDVVSLIANCFGTMNSYQSLC